jgi:hypothetical protein
MTRVAPRILFFQMIQSCSRGHRHSALSGSTIHLHAPGPRTLQATEQPQDQNDNQNRSEKAMRSVTESITACWESAQQE